VWPEDAVNRGRKPTPVGSGVYAVVSRPVVSRLPPRLAGKRFVPIQTLFG
jgi:hypothetical protein